MEEPKKTSLSKKEVKAKMQRRISIADQILKNLETVLDENGRQSGFERFDRIIHDIKVKNVYETDLFILYHELKDRKFIHRVSQDEAGIKSLVQISPEGQDMLEEHGSYQKFLKWKKKEIRKERKRNIRPSRYRNYIAGASVILAALSFYWNVYHKQDVNLIQNDQIEQLNEKLMQLKNLLERKEEELPKEINGQ